MLSIKNPTVPKDILHEFLKTNIKDISSTGVAAGKSDLFFSLESQFKIEFSEKLRLMFKVSRHPHSLFVLCPSVPGTFDLDFRSGFATRGLGFSIWIFDLDCRSGFLIQIIL